jgi:Fe-S cluster assembly ATP-binding protein
MNKLKIKDLSVSVEGKRILNNINLEIDLGKIHVLMGPNGAGKSCLANALMGNPKYDIDSGNIFLNGTDITELPTNERAKLGLFMSFQYPSEVTGVTLSNFLRTAHNSLRGEKVDVIEFHNMLKQKMSDLGIESSFSKRYLNEGFSGGEKKRAEILQLNVLAPKYAILDECDSGLDINSIKVVGESINKMKDPQRGILIITHYYRILNYVEPEVVSILVDGQIVKTGDKSLAEEIERDGFDAYLQN